MCGRVEKPGPDQVKLWLEDTFDEHGWKMPRTPLALEGYQPGEGFPTNTLPTLRSAEDDAEVVGMRWEWEVSWKSRNEINARQETAHEKRTWSKAFRERRCAIVVSGFYEWKGPKGSKKVRHWIHLPEHSLMVLAGLWIDQEPHGLRCVIVTTSAGDVVAPIHDRQPVILPRQHLPRWLDPGIHERGPLEDLLEPFTGIVAEPVDGPISAAQGSLFA